VYVEIDDRCDASVVKHLRASCAEVGITHFSAIVMTKGPWTSRLYRAVKVHAASLASTGRPVEGRRAELWTLLAPHAQPPKAERPERYRSPLLFDDGRPVTSADAWRQRRAEILDRWLELIGRSPPLLEKPAIETVAEARHGILVQRTVKVQAASDLSLEGYILLPEGSGPFPGVLVVYYEPETSVGLKPEREFRDFGRALALRGMATLSIGWPRNYTDACNPRMQTLSTLALLAANCRRALGTLTEIDARRIGVCGHSFGGKWALFAAALCDEFACGAWSDPGIVFDETRPNVNYWEPWYLGWEAGRTRKPGVPTADNPRTGPYAKLVAGGRDLHEILALMAPRPFLVSGGSEDPPERWEALRHIVAVNRLLGYEDRVFMTNRSGHSPTAESNEILCAFFEYFLAQGN
jgi:dienelactone hydrolase